MSDLARIVAYFLLAAVAVSRAARPGEGGRVGLVGLVAALLGAAIVLGVAGELANLGRQLARSEGWYEDRRAIQAAVVVTIAGGTFAACALLFVLRDRIKPREGALLALMIMLGAYLLIHAISLHQLDAVLNREHAGGLRTGDYLELVLVLAMVLVLAVPANLRLDRT